MIAFMLLLAKLKEGWSASTKMMADNAKLITLTRSSDKRHNEAILTDLSIPQGL